MEVIQDLVVRMATENPLYVKSELMWTAVDRIAA
jgi:hypothetical protein